jgi:hypothetical protein
MFARQGKGGSTVTTFCVAVGENISSSRSNIAEATTEPEKQILRLRTEFRAHPARFSCERHNHMSPRDRRGGIPCSGMPKGCRMGFSWRSGSIAGPATHSLHLEQIPHVLHA